MTRYCYALVPGSGPQEIPHGFDGAFDWDAVDDTEKARRGWVRDVPPPYDERYEVLVRTCAQDADGLWTVTYSTDHADHDRASASAAEDVKARRKVEQAKPVSVALAGGTYRFETSREARADLSEKLGTGQVSEAINGPGSYTAPWKCLDGFVTLTMPEIAQVLVAVGAAIDGCFAREAAILAALSAKRKTATLRKTLAVEIETGWPGTPAR